MSVGTTHGISLQGLEGTVIDIEADISAGLPATKIVGLADTAVAQAEHRVKVAVQNSQLPWPETRLTVNLWPAGAPKHGTGFDCAMAVAILAAQGVVSTKQLADCLIIGELSLDGRVRPVPGVLPAVLAGVKAGKRKVYVSAENAVEAGLASAAEVVAVGTLRDLAKVLGAKLKTLSMSSGFVTDAEDSNVVTAEPEPGLSTASDDESQAVIPNHESGQRTPDISEVIGQEEAIAALIVAAAGRHHMFMVGSPGAGKTLLAKCLPGILPELTHQESLETTALQSLTSKHGVTMLNTCPPFSAPHHTTTVTALIGGGNSARPGLVSLCNNGVLFLDEAPEFRTQVLDTLRQSLESGEITVSRMNRENKFPAKFQLIMAANPCPCGNSLSDDQPCICTPHQKIKYLHKLSGPLLDRVDIQLQLNRVKIAHTTEADKNFTSAEARERIVVARAKMKNRLAKWGISVNSEIPGEVLRKDLCLSRETTKTLDLALKRGKITLRSYDRVLRVAWTIADLESELRPSAEIVAKALKYRGAQ